MSENHSEDRGWNVVNFDWFKNPPKTVAGFAWFLLLLALAALIAAALAVVVGATVQLVAVAFAFHSPTSHEAIRNLLLGLAALVGAPFLVWRTVIAQQQANIARESHFTDLFTKAVEQLGADKTTESKRSDGTVDRSSAPNLEVRTGAVYALERIAIDSDRDHWPIMEVLTSYIVENTSRDPELPLKDREGIQSLRVLIDCKNLDFPDLYISWLISCPTHVSRLPNVDQVFEKPRADIAAALRVIGRRPARRIGVEETRNQRLDFRDAGLRRCEARYADLGRANLRQTLLDGALMRHASFVDANASDSSMIRANFRWSDFTKARIADACMIGVDLRECDLDHVEFRNVNLSLARVNNSIMDGAIISRCALVNARLTECRGRSANFDWSRLDGADLSNAHLLQSSFRHAVLISADLSDAVIEGDMAETNLSLAVLYGADLSRVKNISQEQIDSSFEGDFMTKLPPNVAIPQHWPNKKLSLLERDERLGNHPIKNGRRYPS